MNKTNHTIAMMSAQTLPTVAVSTDAPDWVHLLPAGVIATGDKRGPYNVNDAAQMIADSFSESDRLPIDENHATDLAAPLGHPSPARGWIVEMQARADGIWGRVEWSDAGRDLVQSRAYRALSPVIRHDSAKRVLAILRASLVNRPNLRGLTALNHEENQMTLMERLAELLGLGDGATDDKIVVAIEALKSGATDETAMQAQIAEIGVALGLEASGDAEAVLNAAKAAHAATPADDGVVTALQSEIVSLTEQINGLTEGVAREKATAFVDGEIKRGRTGVKPLRDHYISRHMQDAGCVEKELGAMPILARSGTMIEPPEPDGKVSLNAEERDFAAVLGIDPETFAGNLKEAR